MSAKNKFQFSVLKAPEAKVLHYVKQGALLSMGSYLGAKVDTVHSLCKCTCGKWCRGWGGEISSKLSAFITRYPLPLYLKHKSPYGSPQIISKWSSKKPMCSPRNYNEILFCQICNSHLKTTKLQKLNKQLLFLPHFMLFLHCFTFMSMPFHNTNYPFWCLSH